MALPHSLENTMRVHDEAFNAWLGGLLINYGEVQGQDRASFPIIRVMASPEQAWGQLKQQLIVQRFITGADAAALDENAKDFAVFPLPLASFERGDPVPYLEGGGVPKRFARQRFVQGTQKWEEHPWPGSYRTEYRVTIWAKKRYTAEFVREWFFSQLGRLGTADTEVWIDVQHAAPWGTLQQAMRFEGSSDLSNLEGEEPRFIRNEYQFTLNTLHFRPASATFDFEDAIQVAQADLAAVDPRLEDPYVQTGADLSPLIQSSNLYLPYYPPPLAPIRWPKSGAATVAISSVVPDRADPGAIFVKVTAPTDQVDVTNRPIGLDDDDVALLSISAQYLATAAVAIDVQEHDGSDPETPVWRRDYLRQLPAQADWTRFQFFTIVRRPIFDVAVIGAGVACEARFSGIRVHHLRSGTKLAPTSSAPSGPNTRHVWSGLSRAPHLLVCVLSATSGTGTIAAENDSAASDFGRSDAVDASAQRGVVLLIQPKTTSLVLLVPTALTIDAVYAQRYDGGYAGHDL